MTLEQMEYFCELYRQRSITHAADTLHISRQALSAMIKKLEDEFQTPLFVRQNNGILPTPTCDKLYKAFEVNSICFPQDSSELKGPVPSMMESAAPMELTAPQTPHIPQVAPGICSPLFKSSSKLFSKSILPPAL